MADKALLKELTEAFGPSGYESEPAAIVARELAKVCEVTRDGLGSVIGRLEGSGKSGPTIMVSAHLDEIGFMVKKITSDGYVRFLPLGGWPAQVLLGQRVTVRTRKGDFPGVIGSKPPHEMTEEERKKLPEIDKMFIDFGACEGFNLEKKLGLRPGDPIVPFSQFTEMPGGLMMAKAWDDRGGCGILIEVARAVAATKHNNTVCFVGTVQEEVGLRGARTAAELVRPDVAFAVDVSLCTENADTPRKGMAERLKNGAAVLVHDSTMIPNVRLRDFVIETAERRRIRHHLTTVRGGYDTGAVHIQHGGVPSQVIGWPARYIHAHSGIIAEQDYDAAVKLLTAVIERLDAAVSRSLRAF